MPAESAAQQRLFGMALAAKRGKGSFSGKVQELANGMSAKKLREFAKTKHEGLPEKKANMHTLQQKFTNRFVKSAAWAPDDFTNWFLNSSQDIADTINREKNPVTDYTGIGGLLSSGARRISKMFPGVNNLDEDLSFLQKVPLALRNVARAIDRNPNLSAGIGVGVPAAAAAAYLFNKNKKKSKVKVGMILEQAFVNGFVKRAAEYGVDENAAVKLLKSGNDYQQVPLPFNQKPQNIPDWVYNSPIAGDALSKGQRMFINPIFTLRGGQDIYPRSNLFRTSMAPNVRDLSETQNLVSK